MGKDDIHAYRWTCDYCGRMHLLPGDDEEPPLDWIEEEVLAFCCWAHQRDWYKQNPPQD